MKFAMARHGRLPKGTRYLALLASLVLAGCGSDGSSENNSQPENTSLEYQVRITNLTAAQPFSPVAVISHNKDYRVFTIGNPATAGLESLAEGGDNSGLISEAANAGAFAHTSGSSPVAPGGSDTLSVTLSASQQASGEISVVTMLVNTNDAFTGVNAVDISGLGVNDSITVDGISYDSGTEANSEAAGSIPGPADNGEGFNSARDDIADQVRMHSGVITADDGLATSVLNQQHRWDNPTARVTITRLR